MNWLYHFFGVAGSGPYYGFWSGIGADFNELMIFGALLALWRRHNCHTAGCWRIGRHIVGGTPWCNRHHQSARQEGSPE